MGGTVLGLVWYGKCNSKGSEGDMKIWFSWCHLFDDINVKIGIHWYKHKCLNSERFPGWRGFTIVFYLIRWQVSITWVDNHKNYKNRMDYRYSDGVKERAEKRLKKMMDKK